MKKEEILFRIGLMATIFENSFIKQPRYFATHRNQSLNKRHENLSLRFHKVRKHLYPALY